MRAHPLEKKILQIEKEWQYISNKYEKQLSDLRAKLGQDCTHSKWTLYDWEHDNGYGVQTKCKGKRCLICGHEDPYGHRIGNDT